jgi:rod shape determining protein RodA
MKRPLVALGREGWLVIGLIFTLSLVSLINLQSTALAVGSETHLSQLNWLLLGAGIGGLIAVFDYRDLQRFAPFVYGACVVALAVVLVAGREVNGSKRWLELGIIGVQPSEFAKLGVIVALADWLRRRPRPSGYTLRDLGPVALLVGVPMFLVLQEPDLGQTLMIGFIGGTMMLYERFDRRSLVTLLLIGLVAVPAAWSFVLRDYQKDRILTLLDGQSDIHGAGWHARQARIAVGSGGFLGKGHHEGTQVAGGFLPETHTDFVFAHWSEEHGFAGAALVLMLYLALIIAALSIANTARDRFGRFAAVGVAALVFWHVMMNVGMVLNVLPVTGVTLPLMSYGGSSVLTVMCAIGLLLNINLRRTGF